jgi:hypothetical protein
MKTIEPVTAQAVETSTDGVTVILDGRRAFVPWEKCPALLAGAPDGARRHAVLSPGGYGVHWPDLDEDLSVGGLLRAANY